MDGNTSSGDLVHVKGGERRGPFFSICTEVTNRGKTIRRTIESIAQQTYRNFEYIILNNQSDDKSDEVIRQALLDLPFDDVAVNYKTTERKLSDIESWNAPLAHARGKYIVVCEGDDWFAPDHLEMASRVLTEDKNVGLYVSGRGDLSIDVQREKYAGIQNWVAHDVLIKRMMGFSFAPPPSEVIFLREGKHGQFFYDANKYVYAAEYGLYNEILHQGFHGYINCDVHTVFRGHSSYKRRLFHVRDAYAILEQWRDQYDNSGEYLHARMKLLRRSTAMLAAQVASISLELVLLVHIFKEAIFLRTGMPLRVLPKDVIVCIRQRLGTLRARFRS